SFFGSRPGFPSHQASRALFTSGRSCSAACAIFFQRDAVALEEKPERPDSDAHAALPKLCLKFGERQIGLPSHGAENECRLRLDALRPAIPTLLHRPKRVA